jgi:hypothetical protein
MEDSRPRSECGDLDRGPHFVEEPAADDVRAWEQVEAGRYMPRRVRGSCKGRALG